MALTKAQLEERRTGIGGSDAAVILGLNPYQTAYGLYLDKIGEAPPDNEDFLKESRYWGSVLEEPVAQRYAEETGGQDRRIGFEAKTAARSDGWGDAGSAEIPPYIMLQCQHYLAVTGYDIWDLAVLIGNRDWRWYRINPIQKIIDQLIDAEQEFWDRVEHRAAPEPTWQSAATTRLLKDLYPGTNGQVLQLPEVAQSYQDVMDDAAAQRKLFDDTITGCKNRLAMLMGECAVGLLPDGTAITRKEVKRKEYTVAETSYIDTRRVKNLPKLAADAIEAGTVLLEKSDANEEESK
jgi:predicted phage-related endonuclease